MTIILFNMVFPTVQLRHLGWFRHESLPFFFSFWFHCFDMLSHFTHFSYVTNLWTSCHETCNDMLVFTVQTCLLNISAVNFSQSYIQQVGWWKCSMFTILQANTSVTSLISMYSSDRNNETFSLLIWRLFCSLHFKKYDSLTCCYTIQPETSRREIWRGFSLCSRLNLVNWPILPSLCPMSHILMSDELQGAPLTHRIIFLELIS